jgi:hypothetical protein
MTLRPVAAARRTTARRTRTGCAGSASAARGGAHDRASLNFMGLASLGLELGIFCDFLYSILLLNAVLGLDFLGLALSRSQSRGTSPTTSWTRWSRTTTGPHHNPYLSL